MAQLVLGIDFGTYSVKISHIERGFGEFKLIHFYELPIIPEESLSPLQVACVAVQNFLQENDVKFDFCVASLPGNKVSLRNLDLPFVQVRKIDQTIHFELENMIPFDIEDVFYDYCIVSKTKTNSNTLIAILRT